MNRHAGHGQRVPPAPRHWRTRGMAVLTGVSVKNDGSDRDRTASQAAALRRRPTPVYNRRSMSELIFLVEEAPEGGYTARALGEAIFTEADDLDSLHGKIRDAVHCHFDEGKEPGVLRLHFVREEVIAP
jgi:hypothetical protein